MISLLATASILSCTQAQYLIKRINPELVSREEYYDLVGVLIESAPGPCIFIVDTNHNFKQDI